MSDLALKDAKEGRLELRLRREDKKVLEAAASFEGVSIAAYLLAHSLPAARLQASQMIVLGNEARDRFIQLLEKPPAINAALKRAMKRAAAHA
jgi:uncharacterized protein (DUF1778 family)